MNIISIHSLHVWTLSSGKNCITLHCVVNEKNNYLTKVKTFLKKKYKFENITIQFETKEESLLLQCVQN
jgi:Co/Zn/Cd efflux system component